MNTHLPPPSNQPTLKVPFAAAFMKGLRVCYGCLCRLGRKGFFQLGVWGIQAVRWLSAKLSLLAARGAVRLMSMPAVRATLHHSAYISRYFAYLVCVAVIASVILCWLSPASRQAFMARLAPASEISQQAKLSLPSNTPAGGVLEVKKLAKAMRPSAFDARVRKITSARIAPDACDARVLASVEERTWVVDYLARRYRVARQPLKKLVKEAFITGREFGLDPLLLLSVIAIESRFNPYAESGVGAQGLMQVMSKLHADKFDHFGGVAAAFDPMANLKVGALILKDCIVRGGSLAQGLRLYVGASSKYDGIYGAKVQAERERLRSVAQGHDISIYLPQKPSRSVIQAYNKTPNGTALSRPKRSLVATAYAAPKNSRKVAAATAAQSSKMVIVPASRAAQLELGENHQKVDGSGESAELGV